MKTILLLFIVIFLFTLSGCVALQHLEVSNQNDDIGSYIKIENVRFGTNIADFEYEDRSHNNNGVGTWISHISGIQCEISYYPNLESAMMFLEEHNIEVLYGKVWQYTTCSACGCPSGTLYKAFINTRDIPKAKALGWNCPTTMSY